MADIAKKSTGDLMKDLAAKRKALREFRFGIAGSKTRNTKEGKGLRKEISQILTEVNRRRHETA